MALASRCLVAGCCEIPARFFLVGENEENSYLIDRLKERKASQSELSVVTQLIEVGLLKSPLRGHYAGVVSSRKLRRPDRGVQYR
jgi:hypothetical protein